MLNTLFNWAFGLNAALADAATTGGAAATDNAAASTLGAPDLLSTLIPMALIFVVFYFLLIRPQRKKDKKVKEMLSALKVTDRICTIGGIYGTIVAIKDDTFTVAVGQDNVKLVFARWAIRNVEEATVENDSEVLA
jgi:preprotein translocase subunit YajC